MGGNRTERARRTRADLEGFATCVAIGIAASDALRPLPLRGGLTRSRRLPLRPKRRGRGPAMSLRRRGLSPVEALVGMRDRRRSRGRRRAAVYCTQRREIRAPRVGARRGARSICFWCSRRRLLTPSSRLFPPRLRDATATRARPARERDGRDRGRRGASSSKPRASFREDFSCAIHGDHPRRTARDARRVHSASSSAFPRRDTELIDQCEAWLTSAADDLLDLDGASPIVATAAPTLAARSLADQHPSE